ncbi:hypothetical protein [Algivirga pacifica]|uniref:Uncharacterized protein n=1 Tax=Algivirga pacifica TaxID=1162670 RepID=A0ABP9DDJ5_9BACT
MKDVLSLKQYVKQVEESLDQNTPRFYGERNKQFKRMAEVSRWLLAALGIGTSIWFMSALLLKLFPEWVAVGVAGVLLGGWELAKAEMVTVSFRNYYSGIKSSIYLGVLALLFSAGSVYMSVNGAEALYKEMDGEVRKVALVYQQQEDSLWTSLQQEKQDIATKMEAIEKYKETRWGGLLSASENKQLLNYQEQLKTLEEKYHRNEKALREEKVQALALANANTESNAMVFVVMALLVDLLILLVNWYIPYYHKMVVEEMQLLVSREQEDWFTGNYRIQELMQLWKGAPQVMALPQTSSACSETSNEASSAKTVAQEPVQIGFQRPEKPLKTQEESRETGITCESSKHDLIVAAIRGGCRDMRALCRIGFNPLQVKEYLNKYATT